MSNVKQLKMQSLEYTKKAKPKSRISKCFKLNVTSRARSLRMLKLKS